MSYDSSYPRNILNFNRKSQYHLPRDFLHRKHQNKFQFVCCCKFFWNLGTGWISWKKSCYRNVGSTGSYLQIRMNRAVQTRAMCTPFATRQIELCKQVCARFELQKFKFFFCGHTTLGLLQRAAFDRPPAELQKFGPWTGPLFKLPSLLQGMRSWPTGQERYVTQSARPQLTERAGTPSQWLSESVRVPGQSAG